MMKLLLPRSFVAAFLMLAGTAQAQTSQWMTDYSKALEKAKAENKVVLLDFTGSDWCGWCIKMKEETLDQPQFKHYARANLVLVELDFPNQKTLPPQQKQQNDQLKKQFKVQGYPCLVLVDKDGKELGRQGGYLEGGPKAFIKKLNTFYTPAATTTGSGWGSSGNWGKSWSSGSSNLR